jgi:phosphohistidine swiveling domain-containing protein
MVKPKEWILVTTVFVNPLTESLFIKELNKIDLPTLYLDGDVYLRKKDFEKIYHKIKKNPIILFQEIKKQKLQFKNLLKVAQKLNKINFRSLSLKELLSKTTLFFDSFKKVSLFISHPFYFEYSIKKILKEKIKGLKDEDLAMIFSPSKRLTAGEEKIEILKISLEISKNKKLKKLFLEMGMRKVLKEKYWTKKINHLKEKFSFLGKTFFAGEPLSLEYYFNQIKEFLMMDKKEIEKRLKEIKEAGKRIRKKKKEILKKYRIKDKRILNLIKIAEEVSFYRNWRLEITNKSIFLSLSLFNEIARRLGITYKDLVQLTFEEILSSLKKGKISKKLKTQIDFRKKGFGVFMVKNKLKILTERNLEKLKKKFEISYKETKIIKGIIGNSGIARGKCVIINSPKDSKKVEKGNILVTKMTTTEFVPFLKKSIVLVTDIGGLTSHAAIISRELNIPCIIGTKIATKILKDGDLVEVDANKGVVKIIKKVNSS